MKLKYVRKITPRGNSINPLGRKKVKRNEGVKYLPDNLYDGLKVDRGQTIYPLERPGKTPGSAACFALRPSKF